MSTFLRQQIPIWEKRVEEIREEAEALEAAIDRAKALNDTNRSGKEAKAETPEATTEGPGDAGEAPETDAEEGPPEDGETEIGDGEGEPETDSDTE